MKTTKFMAALATALLFLGTTAIFTSCDKDDEDENTSSIVGTWEYADHEGRYVFYADNTEYFEEGDWVRGEFIVTNHESFTYVYDKKNRTLTIDGDTAEVVTLNDKTLMVKSGSGDIATLYRL